MIIETTIDLNSMIIYVLVNVYVYIHISSMYIHTHTSLSLAHSKFLLNKDLLCPLNKILLLILCPLKLSYHVIKRRFCTDNICVYRYESLYHVISLIMGVVPICSEFSELGILDIYTVRHSVLRNLYTNLIPRPL